MLPHPPTHLGEVPIIVVEVVNDAIPLILREQVHVGCNRRGVCQQSSLHPLEVSQHHLHAVLVVPTRVVQHANACNHAVVEHIKDEAPLVRLCRRVHILQLSLDGTQIRARALDRENHLQHDSVVRTGADRVEVNE